MNKPVNIMKEKRILLFVLLTIATMAVWAQSGIAIYQKNGKVARFTFSEKPVVTYSGTDMVMTTNKTSVRYPLNMLKKLVFEDEETRAMGIDAPEVKASEQFSFKGETLSIAGGEPRSSVFLFNMKGMEVGQYRLDSNGSAEIPTHSLEKDIYIVKTNNVSFKFLKPQFVCR